jgi:acetate CoA/acetoacetate CoA-transferase beta subunit
MADDKDVIARRVARELRDGHLVNLGIGLPTQVAHHVPPGVNVFFQAENGLIGMLPLPEEGFAWADLTDAGGRPVGAGPGACAIDSAMRFGRTHGRHLDVTVLGGLQVDEQGHRANWLVPGVLVPGMGGAMDLVTGAKRVIVAMTHSAKGTSNIVPRCTLPLTSPRRVDLIVTELSVIEPTEAGLVLREPAPGVTVEPVLPATAAQLHVPEMVGTMLDG